jgi:uncharacterized membrane protein YdjX (TVP38/TMEM64 family)
LLLFITFLAIIIPFCLFGDAINAWTDRLIRQADSHRLFTGAMLVLLLSVDIVMPVPSSLVSTACGMTLGFAGGTLASFAGMSLSAAAGYLFGRTASPAVAKMIGENELALLKAFQQRHGVWMLLALRPVPVLAEASVLFSGLSRQPLPGVLAATSLGNLAVSLAYAAVGTWGRASDSFLPAFGASLLLSGAFMLRQRRKSLSAPACPASR